jgi:hypothetical protein
MKAWYHPHCMNDPQPEGHVASYIGRRKFLATLGGGRRVAARGRLAYRKGAILSVAANSARGSVSARRRV